MRGRVENDVRAIAGENLLHLLLIADGGNLHNHFQLAPVEALQLLLNIVGVILVNIQNNEALRAEFRHLAGKLAADAAASACDQHHLIMVKRADIRAAKGHFVPVEQIFNLKLADTVLGVRAVRRLQRVSIDLDLAVGLVVAVVQRLELIG